MRRGSWLNISKIVLNDYSTQNVVETYFVAILTIDATRCVLSRNLDAGSSVVII